MYSTVISKFNNVIVLLLQLFHDYSTVMVILQLFHQYFTVIRRFLEGDRSRLLFDMDSWFGTDLCPQPADSLSAWTSDRKEQQ